MTTWSEARDAGLPTYQGAPCGKCQGTERVTATKLCTVCKPDGWKHDAEHRQEVRKRRALEGKPVRERMDTATRKPKRMAQAELTKRALAARGFGNMTKEEREVEKRRRLNEARRVKKATMPSQGTPPEGLATSMGGFDVIQWLAGVADGSVLFDGEPADPKLRVDAAKKLLDKVAPSLRSVERTTEVGPNLAGVLAEAEARLARLDVPMIDVTPNMKEFDNGTE